MHFTTFFKFALVAFAAVPTAFAYGFEDYESVEARDIDVSEHMLTARALDSYYETSEVTARDLGEAIDFAIVQRQLAGEDTQALEARLLPIVGAIARVASTAARVGSKAAKGAAHAHEAHQHHK